MNKNFIALEFDIIKEKLIGICLCDNAKQKAKDLTPYLDEKMVKEKINETTNAKKICESYGTPPLTSMTELEKILQLTNKGLMLMPEQLTNIKGFINSVNRMKTYLKKSSDLGLDICGYGDSFIELNDLHDEISKNIVNLQVDDYASNELKNIRRKIDNINSSIKQKLDSILHSKKQYFADSFVSKRNNRYCLPVKKEYKNQVPGYVVDVSSTKSTVFIEPMAINKLQQELNQYYIEEDNEVRRILYTLTAMVDSYQREFKINIQCMETLDFVFAKAKLSMDMKANNVKINTNKQINIINGRHPLLEQDKCVPLNFLMDNINGIIVTGPNTGGKTVSLKTVGLLSLMVQCGLHVPCEKESMFCIYNDILCDIGDGQSINENLSTFSSSIKNIINILSKATQESLVILDELGSGTDPDEGMGIAIAVLEELLRIDCLFLATTHYPKIKEYAKNNIKIMNARMGFNRETLEPTYTLNIGKAGESCALYIANKLGFPTHLLKIAKEAAYDDSDINEDNKLSVPNIEFIDTDTSTRDVLDFSKISKEKVNNNKKCFSYSVGDSVLVYPQKVVGIVYKLSNDKGELGVQIKKKKQIINHKRVKLLHKASELYPEDYDFSIVFDTVENRKARHIMERKHDPNAVIKISD